MPLVTDNRLRCYCCYSYLNTNDSQDSSTTFFRVYFCFKSSTSLGFHTENESRLFLRQYLGDYTASYTRRSWSNPRGHRSHNVTSYLNSNAFAYLQRWREAVLASCLVPVSSLGACYMCCGAPHREPLQQKHVFSY